MEPRTAPTVRRTTAAAALLAMSGAAIGQSFNIELGASAGGTANPVPASFAACGSPGHWNEVSPVSPSGILLRNLNNQLTSVIMVRPTGQNAVVPASNTDTGDFRSLMADGIAVNPSTNSDIYAFSGLQPGRYLVYIYFTNALSGNDAIGDTIGHSGESLRVQGGGLANKFNAGGNYTLCLGDVAANGQLQVRATRFTANAQANVAGIQLVKLNGGRKLMHVNANATGDNSGSSFANGVPSLIDATDLLDGAYFFDTAATDNTADFDLWVAKGTYNATFFTTPLFNDRDSDLDIMDGTRILGGFDGTETSPDQRTFAPGTETVISGEIGSAGPSDNTKTLLEMANCGPLTLIDHVTLADANDSDTGVGFAQGRGGAVQVYGPGGDAPGPVFRGVKFLRNRAYREGGAVWAEAIDPRFEDCTFDGNDLFNSSSTDADGAGFHGRNADAVFLNCDFFNNLCFDFGNAIYSRSSFTTILNCRFAKNNGDNGTVFIDAGDAEIGNSLFWANRNGTLGAAVVAFREGSEVELRNCTVAFNQGTSNSSGLLLWDSADAKVFNSIIWGNTASLPNAGLAGEASVAISSGVTPTFVTFAYSTVQNGAQMQVPFPAAPFFNDDNDPDFVDITGPDNIFGNADDDFRPLPDSPAVDSGEVSFAPSDELDLDNDGFIFEETPFDLAGSPRVVDLPLNGVNGARAIDRGAYEVQAPMACGPADIAATFGVLDINDILTFAAAFNNGSSLADFFPAGAPNGVLDINDILVFAAAFNAGCVQ